MDSVNDSVSRTGFPIRIAGYNGSYHLTGAYRGAPFIASDCGASTVCSSRLTSQPEDVLAIHHRVAKI